MQLFMCCNMLKCDIPNVLEVFKCSHFHYNYRVEFGVLQQWYQSRSIHPTKLSNVVCSLVRNECVKHCRYLFAFPIELYAGVGLKISGVEALLLGCVSVVRCQFSMLFMATVQVLVQFFCFRIRRWHGLKIFFVNQVGAS